LRELKTKLNRGIMQELKKEFISKFTIEGKNTSLACAVSGDTLWNWITENLEPKKANPVGAEVRQGDSQPVFACAIDRDLFIESAGTWMDVDTFCETVEKMKKTRICKNCEYWDSVMKDCEEEDLFGCIELAQSPYRDGTFGCRKFISKQTA
jgi:hypothetical protein